MEETTLLAYKPLWLNTGDWTLSPANLPDWKIPRLTVVRTVCPFGHSGAEIPVRGCTCGIHSTVFAGTAQQILINNPIDKFEPDKVYMTLWVIQVLGDVIYNEDDGSLRSWGFYTWGIVKPEGMTKQVFKKFIYDDTYGDFFYAVRPVPYHSLQSADFDIKKSMQHYPKLFDWS